MHFSLPGISIFENYIRVDIEKKHDIIPLQQADKIEKAFSSGISEVNNERWEAGKISFLKHRNFLANLIYRCM